MKKIILLCLLTVACATQETSPTGLSLMTESQYENVIDAYTDRIETYKGLYNAVQLNGTIVNSKVAMSQLDQGARLSQWEQDKFNSERLKTQEKLKEKTEIFISFYTPEKKT